MWKLCTFHLGNCLLNELRRTLYASFVYYQRIFIQSGLVWLCLVGHVYKRKDDLLLMDDKSSKKSIGIDFDWHANYSVWIISNNASWRQKISFLIKDFMSSTYYLIFFCLMKIYLSTRAIFSIYSCSQVCVYLSSC